MTKNNSTKKIAVGAAIAGAVGYLAGILSAPKSGKETRADIADKAGELKNSAASELEQLKDELKDKVAQVKAETKTLSDKAKDELVDALAKAKDAQTKAAEVLKAVKAGEANDPELNKALNQARAALKNLNKYLKS